ncbi:hypothetical protein [Actibacterium sp. XHP0104]|uniref:hypothetical protein n=1 Tax=Actibacterium sp. XHP0104 TaxID=2984335 RepID=UPI0021E7D768|nr:hypothetical protein [Actibacterium sp. XHP0104]MCV2880692.1 hypothetical protein [Actibacterium sp. XHP0104]
MQAALSPIISLALLAGATGCAPTGEGVSAQDDYRPSYMGVETRLLDSDLVNFVVQMQGARTQDDVAAYAECAAAGYTLIRGYGFARHVRTNVAEEGGLWRADAVYTISPALPRGVQTIDAEVVVDHCANEGIPTV